MSYAVLKGIAKISIQALYDYKSNVQKARHWCNIISIQALYDYKPFATTQRYLQMGFQFKHCTIISNVPHFVPSFVTYFNSSIVRL